MPCHGCGVLHHMHHACAGLQRVRCNVAARGLLAVGLRCLWPAALLTLKAAWLRSMLTKTTSSALSLLIRVLYVSTSRGVKPRQGGHHCRGHRDQLLSAPGAYGSSHGATVT